MAGVAAGERVDPAEAALVAEFVAFLKDATAKRHPSGVRRRFNQGRATACVDAEFTVPAGLAPELRVGLFAEPRTYRARIRLANAASSSDREKDTRGMAISLLDAHQDFVLNSHPVMMAGTTRQFLDLLRANEAGGFRRIWYFLTHIKAARIASASRANHTSHLEIPYWSTTPYRFGTRVVKYIVRPAGATRTALPDPLTDAYLHDALRLRLARGPVGLDFLVQFQGDPARMPIEDASVEWPESASPYVPVGRITIPAQDVDAADAAACERSSFSPWNCLPEHEPLGGMNRARRDIYRALAEFRMQGN